MLNIKFQGTEYLFTGDSLDEEGALTTPGAYAAGTVSFAHYYPEDGGIVMRWGKVIGSGADLAVVGPASEPEASMESFINCLTHPSWETPDA